MTNSIPFGKKVAAAALAALTLGAGMTMNTGEAEARNGRKGALIAAGVLGVLAAGAIAASANQGHGGHYQHPGYEPEDAYAPPAPVYHHPQPVQYHPGYAHPGYGYHGHHGHHGYRHHQRSRHHGYSETGFAYRGPVCKIRKQQVFDGYGWRVQRVQVCR
ncbi:MAG: hypothetical protein ACRDBL_08520 [Rhabdaerophilum sp.]